LLRLLSIIKGIDGRSSCSPRTVSSTALIPRYDPVYSDARARAATLGEFNFFNAWMSQPKIQLQTFKAWAGIDSDIRYCMRTESVPKFTGLQATTFRLTTSISAAGSSRIEQFRPGWLPAPPPVLRLASLSTVCVISNSLVAIPEACAQVPGTEDTITLLVDWQSTSSSKHKGTAVYTASWTHPLRSGVHTAQHWYYMAEKVTHILFRQGHTLIFETLGRHHHRSSA
jgi:D-galacturonate reductase